MSPLYGAMWLEKKGKFSQRFIGPFEILERIGELAYRLTLPPALSRLHDVFHVSMLRKYVKDPIHIISYEKLSVYPQLFYKEKPIAILDRKDKMLRSKTMPLVKVQWCKHEVEEATWETMGR
ncbi:uncharacterized protein LOC133792304 [Humulus lupulus]|uniref:uncharacterized protein LOC133792304 n=1 Tax=Humulus lupulus TaxID=3486 RepID=UPI002B403367|nr:uncharacterized protein LOC133792304 [Humulus lupulus]